MRYHSHIGQDRWVAETLNYRQDGFFLEFGGFDGISSSNTYTLEKQLGWKGIVVEANPRYYADCCANRNCVTVNAALWSTSRLSLEMTDSHGISSITSIMDFDGDGPKREEHSKGRFMIDTVHPMELLKRFNAPQLIEYMSLDIEGAEFEVLTNIDFDHYHIVLASIEHCHRPERQQAMRSFMIPRGYSFYERFYDDWYFHPKHLAAIENRNETFDPAKAFQTVLDQYVVT